MTPLLTLESLQPTASWYEVTGLRLMAVTALPQLISTSSLHRSFWQLDLVRRSNQRTVPSSPQLRKVLGSPGTVRVSYTVPTWQLYWQLAVSSSRRMSV